MVKIMFFKKDSQGFFPEILEDLYERRKSSKKKMIEAQKNLQNLGSVNTVAEGKQYLYKKYMNEIAKHNNDQLARKVQLNSAYGALGNQYFRFYDVRLAEAVTRAGQLSIRWIETRMNEYLNRLLKTDDVDYVIGQSEIRNRGNIVTRFQALDFLMMMVAARGAANSGRAWGCSGQNQAYRESLFQKVGGFSQIADELQGDDSLFLQLCRKRGSARVVFIDSEGSKTIGRQEKKWSSFLKQRLRWAGDANHMWKFNGLFFLSFLAALVLSTSIIVTLIAGIIKNPLYIKIVVKIFTVKFILDFLLYFTGIRQKDISMEFPDFLIWFGIHTPYITAMGVGSFFANSFRWHGRGMNH